MSTAGHVGKRLFLVAAMGATLLGLYLANGVLSAQLTERHRRQYAIYEELDARECCPARPTLAVPERSTQPVSEPLAKMLAAQTKERDERCAALTQQYVGVWRELKAGPTAGERIESFVRERLHYDLEMWTGAPPFLDVDRHVQMCLPLREAAGLGGADEFAPLIAAAGESLARSDEHVAMVARALASTKDDVAFAAVIAVGDALARCETEALWTADTALVGNNGERRLKRSLDCVRRLRPLVDKARTVSAAQADAFAHTASSGSDERFAKQDVRAAATWALTLSSAGGTHAADAFAGLVGVAPDRGGGAERFLERAIGLALPGASTSSQSVWPASAFDAANTAFAANTDAHARARVASALLRAPARRDAACGWLAQAALDGAFNDNGFAVRLSIPPLCDVAVPFLEGALQSKVGYQASRASRAIGDMGPSGAAAAQRHVVEFEQAGAHWMSTDLEYAQSVAHDVEFRARVGVTLHVLLDPPAFGPAPFADIAMARFTLVPCPEDARFRCLDPASLEPTADSELLVDLWR